MLLPPVFTSRTTSALYSGVNDRRFRFLGLGTSTSTLRGIVPSSRVSTKSGQGQHLLFDLERHPLTAYVRYVPLPSVTVVRVISPASGHGGVAMRSCRSRTTMAIVDAVISSAITLAVAPRVHRHRSHQVM